MPGKLFLITTGEYEQPFADAFVNFARRLARESDGKDSAGFAALKQQADDPASQQPGFAGAGGRMYHDVVFRCGGAGGIDHGVGNARFFTRYNQ